MRYVMCSHVKIDKIEAQRVGHLSKACRYGVIEQMFLYWENSQSCPENFSVLFRQNQN